MTARGPGLALGLCLVGGCTHWHLERNAPGHVEVSKPPVEISREGVERPEDPGERMLVISPGLNAGLGSSQGFFAPLGFETTLALGQREVSHSDDTEVIAIPEESLGLNLGVQRSGGGRMLTYAEAQIFSLPYGFAAGWAFLPQTKHQGPQGTLFLGPLYLRATHVLGEYTELSVGLFVKVPMAIIWSR
jgi:hypothetical protein